MKILEILTPNRLTGNIGERSAAKYLKKNGYKILERNYVFVDKEVDIIAEKDGIMIFAEVKARTIGHESLKEPRPASAVNYAKQQKIISVARYYKKHKASDKKIRFDIIEVYLEDTKHGKKPKEIKHLIGAFDASKRKVFTK